MHTNTNTSRTYDIIAPVAGIAALLLLLRWNFLAFHTAVELFSAIVGLLAFTIAANTFNFTRDRFLYVFGVGSFWVALNDLAHTATYHGMNIVPGATANLSMEFWLTGRFLTAMTLVVAGLTLRRREGLRPRPFFVLFGFAASLLWLAVVQHWLPPASHSGPGFTAFATTSEYFIISLFGLALALIHHYRAQLTHETHHLIAAAILLFMGTEVCFTRYLATYDAINVMGHLSHAVATWLIYLAVVRNTLRMPLAALSMAGRAFDSIPEPVLVVNRNGSILNANRGAVEHFGPTTTDLVPPSLFDLGLRLRNEDYTRSMNQALQNRSPLADVTIDDTIHGRTYSVHLTPVSWTGSSAAAVIAFDDITDLLHAQHALERAVSERDSVLEGMGEGAGFVQDRKLLVVNRRLCELLGRSPDELVGRNTEIIYPDRDTSERISTRAYQELNENGSVEVESPIHSTKTGTFIGRLRGHLLDRAAPEKGSVWLLEDVTEKRALLDALERSEARYRTLFESNKAVELLVNPNTGQIVDANKAAVDYYGYSRDELTQLVIGDINILPPGQVQERMDEALHENVNHLYFRHRLKSGEIRDVEVYSGPIDVNSERLLYSVIHDITDRRRAEALLRWERDFVNAIFDTAGSVIVVIDEDGSIVRMNHAAEQFTGYTTEQVEGRPYFWKRFVPPERVKGAEQKFAELFAAGRSYRNENDWIGRNRERRTFDWNTTVLVSDDGQQRYLISVGNDITERREAEDRVRLLGSALTEAANAIMLTDRNAVIEWVNPAFERLTGYNIEEAIGFHPADLVKSGRQQPDFYTRMWSTIRAGHPWSGEILNRRKDGTLYTGELTIAPVPDEDGVIRHFVGVQQDVSERKQAEQALRAAQKRLSAIIEHFNGALLLEDANRHVVVANQAMCKLLGVCSEFYQADNKDCKDHVDSIVSLFVYPKQVSARIAKLIKKGHPTFGDELKMRDGRMLERDYLPIRDGDQFIGHLWIYRDITERKAHEQRLEHLARTDPLTGIANRRTFLERMRVEFERLGRYQTHSVALLMLDLDHFKRVNDTHGHAAGDEVLKAFTAILQDSVRKVDSLARVGGEEFAILLPETDCEGARLFAERLRRAVAETPVPLDSGPLTVTTSIGVALLDPDDDHPHRALQRADEALYRAKGSGRNRVETQASDHSCSEVS